MDMVAYNPPHSLWRLIEEHISPHETQEIRNMLGESLIEQSLDLHQEVEILLDIWRTFREDGESLSKPNKLPEPPEIRDRLIQEIIFFVEGVKEKAELCGDDPEKIISRHNSDVINYALKTNGSGSGTPRLQTSRCESGRETPMISSANNRLHVEAEVVHEVVSMNDKLNFLQFDEVVANLRGHLGKEVEHLLKDITFLQQCLDNEASLQDGCGLNTEIEPTLSELREERSLLQKELLPDTKMPIKPGIDRSRNHINSPSSKFRPALPMLHNVGPSALKASHTIVPAIHNIPSINHKDIPRAKFKLKSPSGLVNSRIKVVPVGKVLDRYGECSRTHLTPSPPNTDRSTTPSRPSSATRFRKMVLECREGN